MKIKEINDKIFFRFKGNLSFEHRFLIEDLDRLYNLHHIVLETIQTPNLKARLLNIIRKEQKAIENTETKIQTTAKR